MLAGIIGLPFIGKTTVFNALTAQSVQTDGGSAMKPNVGSVQVPDPRLDALCRRVETKKVVAATLQLVDVAGLVKGASQGEGLGNRFLDHVRRVDALIHVVRCFDDPDVPHMDGSVDPVRDVETVELELMMADLQQLEGMLDKARKNARTGDKEAKLRLELIETCQAALSEGRPVSSLTGGAVDSEAGRRLVKAIALLTAKPTLYVANVADDDLDGHGAHARNLRETIDSRGGMLVPVCAGLEAELTELEPSERAEMLEALGLPEPALPVLARATYGVLGLHSFFTVGPKENRAWPVRVGATAPEAAGTVHSDIQRGFIRAEVYGVADLEEHGTEQALRAAGRLRIEGKGYVVQDGDVCHFLFNV